MRTNQRNKQTVWYALYGECEDYVNSGGELTGEKVLSYSAPVRTRVNVSGTRGRASVEMFGIDNPFTRTIVTDDLKTPFDTATVWWIDSSPNDGEHNYRCTGVCRTNNQVVIALTRVDVGDE